MIPAVVLVGVLAVLSCGHATFTTAEHYKSHAILTAKDAIDAARDWDETVSKDRYPEKVWRNLIVEHHRDFWILSGLLGGRVQQMQINAKNGRLVCAMLFD